ncbi:LysR family transcriptional regulator [Anaerobacillus sp. MEB173]|uniref:LysR family transcriptional regulator n=1 Tax=Anaerobacillus sp. MEB173 TaxID=3383345 RepID=UPI003F93EA20
MDEQDWILLITLQEEKNITRTAQKLYITQPAITYRLKHLEEQFRVKLVLRTAKGVEFTSEGEYLLNYVKDKLSELQHIKDNILNLSNEVSGSLRLGVSSNFALYHLPNLLKVFLEKYPEVKVNVKTGWSSKIMQLKENKEVQLGIVRGEHNWHDHKLMIDEEKLCIISKTPLKVNMLPHLPRINYKTDISLKNNIDSWWRERFKDPPLVSMTVDRIETCKEMVRCGLGYAIIPRIVLGSSENLYTIDINEEETFRKTWLIYDENVLELSTANAFVNFIKEHPNSNKNKKNAI